MFESLNRNILLTIKSAADRGNWLAKRLVAHQVRQFLDTLPEQSPIISGPYEIEDFTQPLEESGFDNLMDHYKMVPFEPEQIDAKALKGQQVEMVSCELGSYGIGSYGFFGLFLGENWLIVPIFGAAEWISLDGCMLRETREGASCWIKGGNDQDLERRLQGARVQTAVIGKHHMSVVFDNGAVLEIAQNPKERPKFEGSELPRVFLPGDELRRSVFLSPSGVITA